MSESTDRILNGARAMSASMAAFSAGGVFSLMNSAADDRLLYWASLCFALGLPLALAAFWIFFLPFALGIPVGYIRGISVITSLATISTSFGFVLVCWSISPAHGWCLLGAGVLGYFAYGWFAAKLLIPALRNMSSATPD